MASPYFHLHEPALFQSIMVDLQRADFLGHAVTCNLTVHDIVIWESMLESGITKMELFMLYVPEHGVNSETYGACALEPKAYITFIDFPPSLLIPYLGHNAMNTVPSCWSAHLAIVNTEEHAGTNVNPSALNSKRIQAPPAVSLMSIASSSSLQHISHHLALDVSIPGHLHGSAQEISALQSLSSTGLQSHDLQGLINALEKCDYCGRIFTRAALHAHIPLCDGNRVGLGMDELKQSTTESDDTEEVYIGKGKGISQKAQ
ncbi:hypothetical protein BS47DRAFT_1368635 [Hydnum rufescens UP504]|uniref:Uncharacterized protein n=1 Tax=Hydnum rufescens UP504 TaxID=1448309 RepID=A0A9P6AFZ4_9AGAM|nr:hypothetical protein BS47DRAFT_1368635 [Hydnum rufescens UP504]